MYNKNKLRRFLPGGINDGGSWPFPSTFTPFDLPSGFSLGNSHMTPEYPFTRQGKQDEIFAAGMGLGPEPSAIPKSTEFKSSNPFSYISPSTTAQYSSLDSDTGKTVDAYGNEFKNWEPEKEQEEEEESDIVVQENKIKKKRGFDGEVFDNLLNMSGRFIANMFDPEDRKKCAPGSTWNNATKSCQPLEVQDMMAVSNKPDFGDQVDYGSMPGFRTPEQGNDRNSRSTFGSYTKYGGFKKEGGTTNYSLGEEVYMSPQQLEEFLEAGGQVEYL